VCERVCVSVGAVQLLFSCSRSTLLSGDLSALSASRASYVAGYLGDFAITIPGLMNALVADNVIEILMPDAWQANTQTTSCSVKVGGGPDDKAKAGGTVVTLGVISVTLGSSITASSGEIIMTCSNVGNPKYQTSEMQLTVQTTTGGDDPKVIDQGAMVVGAITAGNARVDVAVL
jgi:hypothetical protein